MFRKTLIVVMSLGLGGVALAAADVHTERGHGRHADHEKRFQARFERADANRDGMVSRAEATSATPRLAVLFDAVDGNKDGQVTMDELRGFRAKLKEAHRAERAQRQAAFMKRLDANGDGTVSKPEAESAPRLAKHFDAMDANRDGQLTTAELEAARRQHHGHRGHGRH